MLVPANCSCFDQLGLDAIVPIQTSHSQHTYLCRPTKAGGRARLERGPREQLTDNADADANATVTVEVNVPR